MNYRIFSIFILLFISACASTRYSSSHRPLSSTTQQENCLDSLSKGGVRSVQVGDELRLILANSRFFTGQTARLKVSAYPTLNQLVMLLNQQKNRGIDVLAYTPSADLQEETTDLAKQQAVVIASYLLDQGLNTRLIVARAWDRNDQSMTRGVRFDGDQPQIFSIEIRTRYCRIEDSV